MKCKSVYGLSSLLFCMSVFPFENPHKSKWNGEKSIENREEKKIEIEDKEST